MSTIEAYGRDARLIHRLQTNYATDAAASDGPFVALPFETFTAGTRQALEPTAENPFSRMPSPLTEGLRTGDGEARVLLDFETIGWWLQMMFGAPSTEDAADPVFVHTFGLSTAIPPFATFEVGHLGLATPLYRRATGFCVQQMSVDSVKEGGAQQFRFGLLGGRSDKAAATLDADPIQRAAIQLARRYQATIALDGSPVPGLVEFTARIGNGLAPDQSTLNGTPDPAKIDPVEQVSGDGTLRIRLRDWTLYDLAKAGTKIDVTQTWSLSASRSLAITYHNLRLAEETDRVEGAGIVEIAFPWRFDAPDSGVSPVTAVLTNGRASYAMPT